MRVSERDNGFPSVGHYATDGSTAWCITDLCGGNIHTGESGSSNYIYVLAVDARENSDFKKYEYDSTYEALREKGGA
jgi:hypothetical protein